MSTLAILPQGTRTPVPAPAARSSPELREGDLLASALDGLELRLEPREVALGVGELRLGVAQVAAQLREVVLHLLEVAAQAEQVVLDRPGVGLDQRPTQPQRAHLTGR